jgi:glycerate 2-kinase
MKIVVAPDKFKGSLTAPQACIAISEGIHAVIPAAEIIEIPMADGGEGTLDILLETTKGTRVQCTVRDPLLRPILANYGKSRDGQTAFIEMAAASGLALLKPEERNCYYTSSFGTGELIRDATDRGIRNIVLCIGGSATNDGGMGMANALGYRFLDAEGHELISIGKNLVSIVSMNASEFVPAINETVIQVACDVQNPFTGPGGASFVFGPQKGASKQEIVLLEEGLVHLADLLKEMTGKDIREIPGSGAAGGLGGGAVGFLNASLVSGIELVMQYNRFEEQIQGANLLITGEGKLDITSFQGKTLTGICKKAAKNGIPVVVLAGIVDIADEQLHRHGIPSAYYISASNAPEEINMRTAFQNLKDKTAEVLAHHMLTL